MFSTRLRILVALNTAAMVTLAGLLGYGYRQAMDASAVYQQARTRLVADIKAAKQEGLPSANLTPITTALSSLDRTRTPLWPSSRTNFYLSSEGAAARLDAELAAERQRVLLSYRTDTATQLANAQAAIGHDQQVEVADITLASLTQRLAALSKASATAQKIKDWQSLDSQATALSTEAVAAAVHQEQENAAIQQASTALLQQTAGNVTALQQAGNAALASGRNDATVATYESKPGRFAAITALTVVYQQSEHYAARLASPDPKVVAYGAAAVQRYSDQIHQMLVQGLAPKHIIVSFQAQRAWAYENGKVVMDALVTTGIRGVTDIGTDFGPMKVLFRSHPYTMRSPWPKTSPHYYPDTVVQWTTFFTSEESFHDASWEPDSLLGPGSQFNTSTRSHGCIHLLANLAQWMNGWATEGTPVDVVPGNGQPVAEQLSEMTTDSQGKPLSAP
jgi:lipoprotein-anchoring transpeptidase ErfK/SrfK